VKFTERTQVTLRAHVTDEKKLLLSEYPNQWIFGDPRSYEVSSSIRCDD
jgi:hypothetical protein